MLYLVATPIGNLSDITFRAIEILKKVDYILCEDTRHSLVLLNHYEISKRLKSYHKFNENQEAQEILANLQEGQEIALISDAGTPGISDPGSHLVKLCIENNIPVTSIPGPCAAIQALSCSGFSTDRFQFRGFLPKKSKELKECLSELISYEGTTICYESPHRLLQTVQLICELDPQHELVIARELTKKFEESLRGTAKDLLIILTEKKVKGEIVLLLKGGSKSSETTQTIEEELKELMESQQLSLNQAVKLVSQRRGIPKNEIYKLALSSFQ